MSNKAVKHSRMAFIGYTANVILRLSDIYRDLITCNKIFVVRRRQGKWNSQKSLTLNKYLYNIHTLNENLNSSLLNLKPGLTLKENYIFHAEMKIKML